MAGLWPLTIKNGIFTEAEVRDAKIGMATYWLLHCGEKRRISWTGWVGRMGGGGGGSGSSEGWSSRESSSGEFSL